jgi:DNA-binding transcriptional LysR family regulator
MIPEAVMLGKCTRSLKSCEKRIIPPMKLAYLQALRAVMDAGTVTGAAARLGRTQPQISRLILDLERDLRLKLFSRTKRRLVPTQEARDFYVQALRVLDRVDEIPAAVRKIRAQSDLHLNLACQSYIAQALLPEAIAAFVKEQPRFTFSVEIRSRAEMGRWLDNPPYDLAIVALPIDHDLLIRCDAFAVARVVAVLPRGHRLAKRKIIDARELAKEPFIALTSSTLLRKEIDRMFFELGEQLTIRGEASAGMATCQMVARGLGVTLADPLEARYVSSDEVVVRELKPQLNFTYGFLRSATTTPSELNLRFAECVARTAKSADPTHIRIISSSAR